MSGLCVFLSKVDIQANTCADLDCVVNCDTGVTRKYSSSIDVNILIGLFSLYISRPRCKNIYKIANSVTVITHVQY